MDFYTIFFKSSVIFAIFCPCLTSPIVSNPKLSKQILGYKISMFVGGFTTYPSNSQDTKWMSCSSAQFWHFLPGDSIKDQRLGSQSYRTVPHPTSDASHKPRLSSVLLMDWRLEVPMTSSFGCVNLLEQLPELGETFYLLGYRLIRNMCKSGTARWKRPIGQGMDGERARGFRTLFEHDRLTKSPCVQQPEAFRTLSFWVFLRLLTYTRVVTSLATGDWYNL